MRRQWAAAESRAYGWGGVRAVGGIIGMSPNTIREGLAELAVRGENPEAPVESGLRRKGGGRKKHAESDPQLLRVPESLVEPTTQRRSRIASAMDPQEHGPVGAGVDPPETPGQPAYSGASAQRIGVQPAGQPQDPGRQLASGSQPCQPSAEAIRQSACRQYPQYVWLCWPGGRSRFAVDIYCRAVASPAPCWAVTCRRAGLGS